jgi:hypothetical protein
MVFRAIKKKTANRINGWLLNLYRRQMIIFFDVFLVALVGLLPMYQTRLEIDY